MSAPAGGGAPGDPVPGGPAPGEMPHGGPPPGDPAPGGPAPASRHLPAWLFPLGMLVALEPPVLIVLWAADGELADGHLLGIALVGGLFVSLPSLAILALAVIWDRRLSGGRTVPGLPPALTGPRASRISATTLVASTVVLGGVLALLLGQWALVALPPLGLSLASAWLMARAA